MNKKFKLKKPNKNNLVLVQIRHTNQLNRRENLEINTYGQFEF